MSRWTHVICEECYEQKEPGRQPHRVESEYAAIETCCFCGVPTDDGIYYRADPATTQCKGTCDG